MYYRPITIYHLYTTYILYIYKDMYSSSAMFEFVLMLLFYAFVVFVIKKEERNAAVRSIGLKGCLNSH